MSAAEYRALYGQIASCNIIGYYKYEFILRITTEKQYTLDVSTGGDRDAIYRYNPFETSWDEHESVGINAVLKRNTPPPLPPGEEATDRELHEIGS
jgi:hypothetical protein